MARTVLLGVIEASATASQRLTRSSLAGYSLFTVPVRRTSTLALLAQEKRRELESLMASEVTASLRREVEGRTWLASLLPTREHHLEAVARRELRRVFTLHRPQAGAVRVKRD